MHTHAGTVKLIIKAVTYNSCTHGHRVSLPTCTHIYNCAGMVKLIIKVVIRSSYTVDKSVEIDFIHNNL
jgi:hypothetical protein